MASVRRALTMAVAAVACAGPVWLVAQPTAAQVSGCDSVNDPERDRAYTGISAFEASMAEGDTVSFAFTTAQQSDVTVTVQIFDAVSGGSLLYTDNGLTPVTLTHTFVDAAPTAYLAITVGSPLSSSTVNGTLECVPGVPASSTTSTPDTSAPATSTTMVPTTSTTTAPTSTAASVPTSMPTTTLAAPSTPAGGALPPTGLSTSALAVIALALVSLGFAAMRTSRRQL